MTYLATEQSAHDGRPVELFLFGGSFANFYYTSGPVPVDFEGNTYEPVTIQRSEIGAGTQEDDGLSITVDLPVGLSLVQIYAFQIAPPRLRLTIYRFHDIADWVPYWQGIVGQFSITGGIAQVRSPSILEVALTGTVPTVYYQTSCNHVLYDVRCGIDRDAWSQIATVDAINGRTLTLSTIGGLNGQLVGGEAVLGSFESRMITGQFGNDVTVNYPYSSVEIGDAVTIAAGCDLSYRGDCITKFANGPQFGGFVFIPPDNMFETGIEPGKSVPDVSCLHTPCFQLVNPTFEIGTMFGWTRSSGAIKAVTTATSNGGVSPYAGSFHAQGGTSAGFNTFYQDLPAPTSSLVTIDAGTATISGFSAYHSKYPPQTDHGRLFISFLDLVGAVISTVYSAYDYSDVWTLVTVPPAAVPVGTRTFRVGAENVRDEGLNNDNYWDNFTTPMIG
jgi:hypothetical protein